MSLVSELGTRFRGWRLTAWSSGEILPLMDLITGLLKPEVAVSKSVDDSLASLVREGVVSREEALRQADDPKRIPS